MLFAICEAQARCVVRRLASAFAAAPLVVGGFVLVVALVPAASWWAGVRTAPALQAADPSLLAVGAGLTAAVVGAVLTLLVPARPLGTQLEAAPVPRGVAAAAFRLLIPGVALVALSAPVALFLVPVAGRGTPAILLQLAGAGALGGAAAEAALAFGRRSLVALPVLALVALLVLARGRVVAAPIALAVWGASLVLRPRERAARATVRVVARRRALILAFRYGRRRDVRRQVAAGVAVAVAGAVLLRVTGVPNDVAVVFGGATSVFGAAVVPLAAPGLDHDADWLWRAAPAERHGLALLHGAVALGLGFALATVGIALVFAAAPARVGLVPPLAAGAAVVLGAALLGGSLVPWRADRIAEQLASYAAFAVVLTVLWLALARSALLLRAEHGASAGALTAAALVSCLGAATLVTARRT